MADSTCQVDGCERNTRTCGGLCNRHYTIALQYGSPSRPQPDKAWLNGLDLPPGAKAIPVLISREQGFTFAIVDEADYEPLAQRRWHLAGAGYASRTQQGAQIYMHRHLMQTPSGMDTDHINRNKLDNRRSNLRVVDRSTNNFNTGPNKANTSGHKGVSWFKPAKLWRAYIKHQPSSPKRIELGYFKTKEEAIAARRAAEERLLGECA